MLEPTISQNARFFDRFNKMWEHNVEYNMLYLRMQQQYFNDLLKMRGHVFLNEVYDALGFERSRAAMVAGWVLEEGKSTYIDFGLYSHSIAAPSSSLLLDFNCDEDITDRVFPPL